MALEHRYAEQFLDHLRVTQSAYETRRIADYLAGFDSSYFSVQLDTDWNEDKAELEQKIQADFDRFNLLSMEFEVLNHWFSGETGYAHLGYDTHLAYRDSGKVLVDRRENLIVAEHSAGGNWLVKCKIVLKASNFFESELSPDI